MIAAIASPSPTRPRAAPPTRNTTPISTANAGTCQRRARVDSDRSLIVGMKDLLDSRMEEPGDLDRERQGPAGLPGLDGERLTAGGPDVQGVRRSGSQVPSLRRPAPRRSLSSS